MSTYVFLVCLDHDPPLSAVDESSQHLHREGVLEEIQEWVDKRDVMVPLWDEGRLNYNDYFLANTMRFLAQHTTCRVAAHSEYGEWIDLGHGLPDGAEPWGRKVATVPNEPFDWSRLGTTGDLPTHFPMGVNEDGQGPTEPDPAHHYACWCGEPHCPLTSALVNSWEAGRRSAS